MNIFLVGFMGSGKSSLGKKLAGKLERPFVDLDHLIEEKERRSISEIFSQQGENHFRELEKSMLFQQDSSKEAVVSLGGGACCNDLSWNFLEQNGLVIYLKEDEGILLGRLRQNREDRPLISSLSDDALKDFIHQKLMDRAKYYDRSHFIYEKDKTSIDFLIKHIRDFLGE